MLHLGREKQAVRLCGGKTLAEKHVWRKSEGLLDLTVAEISAKYQNGEHAGCWTDVQCEKQRSRSTERVSGGMLDAIV